MKFLAIILLAITLASVAYGQGSTGQCSFNGINYASASNGSYSALNAASGTTQAGKYRYYWNICGACKPCNAQGVVACQTTVGGTGNPQSVGQLNLGTFAAGNGAGPILTYKTNANSCSGNIFRSIDITLKCGTGNIIATSVVEESKCTYGVVMTGSALCSGGNTDGGNTDGGSNNGSGSPKKSGGIGGGWIFIIILLSCSVVYIVGGVIFNAKVKHQHGTDMFPNKELWVNFGGLIKDGVFFIKSKVTGSGGAGYQQV